MGKKAKLIAIGATAFMLIIGITFIFFIPTVLGKSVAVLGGEDAMYAKISWREAKPFAISDYAQRDNQLILMVKNNSPESLLLERVCVSGDVCEEYGASLGSGIKRPIIITVKPCEQGEEFRFGAKGIIFEYSNGMIQAGRQAIVGKCV